MTPVANEPLGDRDDDAVVHIKYEEEEEIVMFQRDNENTSEISYQASSPDEVC